MGLIDFDKDAIEIDRQIRAFTPWPSAFTYFNGKKLKIWRAVYAPDKEVCLDPGESGYGPEYENMVVAIQDKRSKITSGQIVEVAKDYIRVKCKKGNVMIYELQAEGKKRLTVSEFIKGNRLQVGDILGNK